MDLKYIESLLEKYHNGTTNIEEERLLKVYFSTTDVAPHLKPYQPLFKFFDEELKTQYAKPIPFKPRKNNWLQWGSIAAVVLLLVAVYINKPTPKDELGTFTEDEVALAYQTFKETMALVSINLNKGVDQLQYLDNINQGVNELQHLKTYNQATQIIFKPKY